jgi:hypothetical protein
MVNYDKSYKKIRTLVNEYIYKILPFITIKSLLIGTEINFLRVHSGGEEGYHSILNSG